MKFRLRLIQQAKNSGTAAVPESCGVLLADDGQEDPHFVPKGTNPGRRYPVISLRIDQLTLEAAREFTMAGDYVLTLEAVPKR